MGQRRALVKRGGAVHGGVICRYAKSRSESQLRGDNGTAVHGLMGYLTFDDSTTYLDKCAPVQYATDGAVIDPCGLVRISPASLYHSGGLRARVRGGVSAGVVGR
jgi:hypothetical protein